MTSANEPNIERARAIQESMQSSLEKLLAEGPKVSQEFRELRIIAKSDDGNVEVTVNAQGQVENLRIDPRIYRKPDAKVLADSVLKTIRAAASEARDKSMSIAERIAPRATVERSMSGDIWGNFEDLQKRFGEVLD